MKIPILRRLSGTKKVPFDPRKPFNALPHLPPPYNFDQVAILKQVNLANIALSKLDALATKLPNLFLLMHPLLVRESVASSGIENINTTVREVFEAEVLPEGKQKGPAKEVLHYREAMLKGIEFVAKGKLTVHHILELQKLIEPKKAGLRAKGVHLWNENTKQVFFTPPEGRAVRELLINLEKYANEDWEDVDPLIKMAVIHYQFESIHPFLDGNGRAGRILMILYLILKHRLQAPVLFLSGFIERHKNEYYRLFRQVTKSQDFGPFVLFILKGVEEQAAETAKTVSRIEALMLQTEKTLKREFPNAHDLVLCMFSRPLLTIDYVQETLGLSARQTASKYLVTIAKMGLLTEKKEGRQKVFYSTEFLKLLS